MFNLNFEDYLWISLIIATPFYSAMFAHYLNYLDKSKEKINLTKPLGKLIQFPMHRTRPSKYRKHN